MHPELFQVLYRQQEAEVARAAELRRVISERAAAERAEQISRALSGLGADPAAPAPARTRTRTHGTPAGLARRWGHRPSRPHAA
ncbi:hypothetical protein [Isoptericola aurantiacus]|uniref:hypothetical protein n=1 Tax=Isoptericola aurantiacus TaxID=3377839 RepID=UPI00383B5DD3